MGSSIIIEGNNRSSSEEPYSIFNHQFIHDLNAVSPSDSKVFLLERLLPQGPSSDFLNLLLFVLF